MRGRFLLAVLCVSLSPGALAGQDAETLNQQACDAGDLAVCDQLGVRYETGEGVIQDQARALSLFQQACDGGLLLGCTHLGLMFGSGAGIDRDPATAGFLYERACDGGDLLGCAHLGVSYERGEGVTRDPVQAVNLYERSCGGGEMLGCTNLGSMYRTGRGVTVDLGAAVSLYWRACESGLMLSCVNLAVSYELGEGVAQDLATAVNLYLRACESGLTLACDRIGVTYEPAAAVASADARATSPDGFGRAGWVVDSETNDPLSEAIVRIPELGISVISDVLGRIVFPDLPTGRHRLHVEAVGYERMEGDLDVPDDRAFQLGLDRTTLADRDAPGQIRGRVLEGGREFGVADVEITVLTSTPRSTLSGPLGRFSLTDLETGLVEVRFERLGYASRTATVIVQPERTVDIAASMSARPIDLDPIRVVVRSRALEQNGFYLRENVGGGSRLTREDLMAIDPLYISDIFRRLPGVSVENGQVLGRRTGAGGQCNLRIYLDGLVMEGWDFDSIPAEYLEGMEVYQGLAVPIQYGPGCGVVLLWTRGG